MTNRNSAEPAVSQLPSPRRLSKKQRAVVREAMQTILLEVVESRLSFTHPEANTIGDHAPTSSNALDSPCQQIRIVIDGDIERFTSSDRDNVLWAIATVIDRKEPPRPVRYEEGSIRMTFNLSPDEAERLLLAVAAGHLVNVAVIEAELLDGPAQILPFDTGLRGAPQTIARPAISWIVPAWKVLRARGLQFGKTAAKIAAMWLLVALVGFAYNRVKSWQSTPPHVSASPHVGLEVRPEVDSLVYDTDRGELSGASHALPVCELAESQPPKRVPSPQESARIETHDMSPPSLEALAVDAIESAISFSKQYPTEQSYTFDRNRATCTWRGKIDPGSDGVVRARAELDDLIVAPPYLIGDDDGTAEGFNGESPSMEISSANLADVCVPDRSIIDELGFLGMQPNSSTTADTSLLAIGLRSDFAQPQIPNVTPPIEEILFAEGQDTMLRSTGTASTTAHHSVNDVHVTSGDLLQLKMMFTANPGGAVIMRQDEDSSSQSSMIAFYSVPEPPSLSIVAFGFTIIVLRLLGPQRRRSFYRCS